VRSAVLVASLALPAFACSGGRGDARATAAPAATPSAALASGAPAGLVTAAPRKGIDGVLLPASEPFAGVVAVPAAAVARAEAPRFAAYDVKGPFADVLSFYARHHPDAARTDADGGTRLVLTPPGPDVYVVFLQKVGFELTRIVITPQPRFPPPEPGRGD
jgi:hypothetical protein